MRVRIGDEDMNGRDRWREMERDGDRGEIDGGAL